MKGNLHCPPLAEREELKLLICIDFGGRYTGAVLSKLERVIFDLDYVYVNIIKILRHPKAEENQRLAKKEL